MKFVTLTKDFTTVDPKRNLFPVTIKKGTRFGLRTGNMFENGDHGYKGNFHRVHYFRYFDDLIIPYEYLSKKSVETLKKISSIP